MYLSRLLLAIWFFALAGLWLHYRGNVAFEVEMYPGLSVWRLLWQAAAGATPALAPGTMGVLAMIGHVVTVARSRGAP